MLDSILRREKSKYLLSWQQQLDLLKYAYKRALSNNPLPITKFASIVYCVHVNRLESTEENLYSFLALAGEDNLPSNFVQKWASQYFETAQYVYDCPDFKKVACFHDDLTFGDFVKQALIFESQQEVVIDRLLNGLRYDDKLGSLLKKAQQQDDNELSMSDIFKFMFSRDVPLSYKLAFIAGIPIGLLGLYSLFTGGTMQGLLLLGLGGLLSYGTYYTVGTRLASIVEENPRYLAALRSGERSIAQEPEIKQPEPRSPVRREIVTRGRGGVPPVATGLSRTAPDPLDIDKYIFRPKTSEPRISTVPPTEPSVRPISPPIPSAESDKRRPGTERTSVQDQPVSTRPNTTIV